METHGNIISSTINSILEKTHLEFIPNAMKGLLLSLNNDSRRYYEQLKQKKELWDNFIKIKDSLDIVKRQDYAFAYGFVSQILLIEEETMQMNYILGCVTQYKADPITAIKYFSFLETAIQNQAGLEVGFNAAKLLK